MVLPILEKVSPISPSVLQSIGEVWKMFGEVVLQKSVRFPFKLRKESNFQPNLGQF
jgi:hypothetical protein